MNDKDYYKNLILYLNNEISTAIKCLEALQQQVDERLDYDEETAPTDEALTTMEL